ncbi:MAG TPA: alkaline phosphatase family protein [Burkholderiales bacterium]|nr:alkaline phosphatase family protein [Burkholderiales bacterium]
MVRPDYAGAGLLNLIASLAAARGARALHPTLEQLPPAEIAAARNVVLLIVDGLGDGYLTRRGAGGELERRRRGAMTSVFPSTTASAITTSYTGCAPLEHGLTGWFTYFGAAGCVAAPLPFRSRGDFQPLGARGVEARAIYASASLFDALPLRSVVVSQREIIDSEYNLHHCGRAQRRAYDDLGGLVRETEAAVKSGDERKFVYVYWPLYDTVSHRHGAESPQAAEQFAAIDAAFGALLARLAGTDSAVVATADHGFIDCPPETALQLEDGPGLSALLRFPLCGERRVAYCHVQHGQADEFMARAAQWLEHRAQVRTSRELLAEGWFGAGPAHPRIAERVGDVALVMNERFTIKDWTPGEPRQLHIGNHGGASAEEMTIPLVVAAT